MIITLSDNWRTALAVPAAVLLAITVGASPAQAVELDRPVVSCLDGVVSATATAPAIGPQLDEPAQLLLRVNGGENQVAVPLGGTNSATVAVPMDFVGEAMTWFGFDEIPGRSDTHQVSCTTTDPDPDPVKPGRPDNVGPPVDRGPGVGQPDNPGPPPGRGGPQNR